MNREEVLEIVAAAHKNNTRADLCGVSLHDVDLSNANLTGADLRGAKLSA